MSHRIVGICILAAWGLAGCATANPSGDTCSDPCTAALETRCAGSTVQLCQQSTPDCLQWVEGQDCGAGGQLCVVALGNALCAASCSDRCSPVSSRRCQGDVIQQCGSASDGCLDWQEETDCSDSGQLCDASSGTPVCVAGCSDGCPTESELRCNQDALEICSRGTDGCLAWTLSRDCDANDESCDDSGTPVCVPNCQAPPTPAVPVPAAGAQDVDAAAVTSLDWSDAVGAVGFDVYFGSSCPPPTYPDAAFTSVVASQLTGVSLAAETDYCWQVVARASADCYQVGPVWTFRTACTDAFPGAPTVTSTHSAYAAGTTSGVYTLTFNEAVANVVPNLTWTQLSGFGSMTAAQQSPQVYEVSFSGVADGDQYRLTVGTGVQDDCGNALASPVELMITIGGGCSDPIPGAPTVTSSTSQAYPAGTTSGTYTLTFSEDVSNVASSLTWTQLVGTGAMSVSQVTASSYDVDFTGAADGDSYRLTVGTGVIDSCVTALAAPVNIDLDIGGTPPSGCDSPLDITAGPFPVQSTGTFPEDPPQGGSCDLSPTNAIWYTYTPPATGSYEIAVTNANSSGWATLAIFTGSDCAALSSEVFCGSASAANGSTTQTLTGGVTYLLLHHTDGDSYSLLNPSISVTLDVPVTGDLCTDPVDLSAVSFPHVVTGSFDEDPATGGSCDTLPNNAIWYRYTPTANGFFTISASTGDSLAGTRLAVFTGTGCSPLGAEQLCEYQSFNNSISGDVQLQAGQAYLILFYTDSDFSEMLNPSISITPQATGPGIFCTDPFDLNSVSLPHQLTGTFADDPTDSNTCDFSPYNAAWFSYSPPDSGYYLIEGVNADSGSNSRIVVYDGLGCSPYGTELDCGSSFGTTSSVELLLTSGQDYLIAFHTGDDYYDMTDPQLDITPLVVGPGELCTDPFDLNTVSLPHQLTGTFAADPASGNACDSTPYNGAWFTYTPPASGYYEVTGVNGDTNSDSRIVVYEGSNCSPLGTELDCGTSFGTTSTTQVLMQSGQSYLILFHAGSDAYDMEDPQLNITALAGSGGEFCADPVDVSGAAFPYTLTGSYLDSPTTGSSCDTTPGRAVWYQYSPTVSGIYSVEGVNGDGSSDSRIAVFSGTGCGPYGPELGCDSSFGTTSSVDVAMLDSQDYLILLYSGSSSYDMDNPQLDIQAQAVGPGVMCQTPAPVTVGSPVSLTGSFEDDPPATSCASTPTDAVWFSFTPASSGDFEIALVNNTFSSSYGRLAVFTGTSCNPWGAEVDCYAPSTKNVTRTVTLSAGIDYLILFHTDGETWPMEDPQITINAI